jgi:hypothetical protein
MGQGEIVSLGLNTVAEGCALGYNTETSVPL